jgi:putative ABC transport system ATP-binding protein
MSQAVGAAPQSQDSATSAAEHKAPTQRTQTAEAIISLSGVRKTYHRGKEPIHVLSNLDLSVPRGGYEALMGPSGSGKSTLLNLIAGLDRPSEGRLVVAGADLSNLSDSSLATWRSNTIGFIFQAYNLMPVLTAVENVELPLLLTKLSSKERKERARTALRIVGLEDRMHHYPRQLSGGQEQRVAIARAIVNDPQVLVADEPTGDLDRQSADDILTLLSRMNQELGKTIIMVTHDPAAAERAQVTRRLDKGRLI